MNTASPAHLYRPNPTRPGRCGDCGAHEDHALHLHELACPNAECMFYRVRFEVDRSRPCVACGTPLQTDRHIVLWPL